MQIEDIARVAHEANRAYCEAMGDHSQVEWKEAPFWQRESCINGVKFHLENPGTTPEMSHKNWLAQKQREGWKWGPEKDEQKKEHPCFQDYQDLPAEQKAKDYIFTAIVSQLRHHITERW